MNEPTSIYRFYRRTCQRVRCAYTVLNSACAFIITSDRSNKVVLWIGKNCALEDQTMSQQYAILLRRQLPENGPINLITEGRETGIGLDNLTQILWMTMDDYVKESAARESNIPPPNCPKIFYSIIFNSKESRERSSSSGNLSPSGTYGDKAAEKTKVCKLCTVVPDAYGTVPLIQFPGKGYASVYLLVIGDQLDLWISDDCPQKNISTAKSITLTISQEKLEGIRVNKKLEPVLFGCNTRNIKEGYERCLFLTHFSNKSSFGSKIQLHEPTTCTEDLPPPSQEDNTTEKSTVSQTWNRVAREIGIWHLLGSIPMDSISSTLSMDSISSTLSSDGGADKNDGILNQSKE